MEWCLHYMFLWTMMLGTNFNWKSGLHGPPFIDIKLASKKDYFICFNEDFMWSSKQSLIYKFGKPSPKFINMTIL